MAIMNEDKWKEMLTPEQYYVLRDKGTEPAFIGKYVFGSGDKTRANKL